MPEVDWTQVDADSIPAQKIYENSKVQEALGQHEGEQDLESVKVPYVMEDAILMSPGTWNGVKYNAQVIKQSLGNTDWEDPHNRALFWDHNDEGSEDWIGEVKNIRMDGNNVVGDLVVVDKQAAIKLEYGAHFGISPKVTGRAQNREMKSFSFDNFSVVLNPAIKTTWLNSEEERPRIHVTEVRMSMSDDNQVDGRREEFDEYVNSDSFKEKFENADSEEDRERMAALLSDVFDLSEEDVLEALPQIENADDDDEADEAAAEDEADADAEADDAEEEMADIEALADKVMERIESMGDDKEEAAEAESEEYSDGEVAEFQQFVSEMKQEHPELSFSEIVEQYEEANRNPVEALQERINELESKLEGQVEEMSEKAAQRVSEKTGKAESRQEELQQKVAKMEDDELDAAMTQMFKQDYSRGSVTMPTDGDAA